MISCLMSSNVSLSDEDRELLFRTACTMIEGGFARKKISSDWIEGVVETSFEVASIGSIVGILFKAQVETSLGVGKVGYIVRLGDVQMRRECDQIFGELEQPMPSRMTPYNN